MELVFGRKIGLIRTEIHMGKGGEIMSDQPKI